MFGRLRFRSLGSLCPVFLAAAWLTLPAAAFAAAGDLDPTFSGDGKRATDFAGDSDVGFDPVVQPDGKIVVAGYANVGGDRDFAVARFRPNGAPDTTFSGDGKRATDFAGEDDAGAGVALQPDGRIVVAGVATESGNAKVALARFRPNGALDTTFSGDGKQTTDFSAEDDEGFDVAIQPDGKIVVAGRARQSGGNNFAVLRYRPNGTPDTTFAGDGRKTTDIAGDDDRGFGIALQPDGRIMVAGRAGDMFDADFGLARYRPNGAPDTTFSGDGKQTTDFGAADDEGFGVTIQPDGKAVVAGRTTTPTFNRNFAVARYRPNGAPDTTFAGDGRKTTDFSGEFDVGADVVLQPDGRILVAGLATVGGDNDFGLARYRTNGALDTTFAGDGRQTTDFAGGPDAGQGIARQPDGKIVVVGEAFSGASVDFAVARYLRG